MEVQIMFFNAIRKQKMKNGNVSCNSVVRSAGKTKIEAACTKFKQIVSTHTANLII